MKILVAPLNWGLGHATRCVPIINNLISHGCEVHLASDGAAKQYLSNYFPNLKIIELPELNIYYSKTASQVAAISKQSLHILKWIKSDHRALAQLQQAEHYDMVISDNRFGFYNSSIYCIYITHQLHILMPRQLKFLEPLVERVHRGFIDHYNECWIPDDEQASYAGVLSHPHRLPSNAKYIGLLSRFKQNSVHIQQQPPIDVLAILSGPEPQRTMFEQQIQQQYGGKHLFIASGKEPFIADDELLNLMQQAKMIISRSGYSSIMDYVSLGIIDKVKMIPTPGQTEQEYLAEKYST